MMLHQIHEAVAQLRESGRAWLELLRSESLSVGVYHLRAGQADPQRPHTEDEVYHVVSGRCRFMVGDDVVEVAPGAVLYVERRAVHRFFDITEDLTALVFFAPPEGAEEATPPLAPPLRTGSSPHSAGSSPSLG